MYKVERILYDGSGCAHRRVFAVDAAKTIKTRHLSYTVFVCNVGGGTNTHFGDVLSAKNTKDTSGDNVRKTPMKRKKREQRRIV